MKETKDFNTLPVWLRSRIALVGLSPEEFARMVGVSRVSVYNYLSGHSRPNSQTMVSICHVLEVPLEEGFAQYSPPAIGRPKRLIG